jgi:hypothetical protein
MIRQGDVLFIPVSELPARQFTKRETGIIQEGEATGHHHRIAILEDAEVLEAPSEDWRNPDPLLYMRVGPNGIAIVHEEHNTVMLPANTLFKVHRAREYDYFQQMTRPVYD